MEIRTLTNGPVYEYKVLKRDVVVGYFLNDGTKGSFVLKKGVIVSCLPYEKKNGSDPDNNSRILIMDVLFDAKDGEEGLFVKNESPIHPTHFAIPMDSSEWKK